MSDHRPWVEVGELWGFNNPYEKSADHYLILQIYSDRHYGYLYRSLHIESGDIVPDLIIDEGTVRNYNAHKVA